MRRRGHDRATEADVAHWLAAGGARLCALPLRGPCLPVRLGTVVRRPIDARLKSLFKQFLGVSGFSFGEHSSSTSGVLLGDFLECLLD